MQDELIMITANREHYLNGYHRKEEFIEIILQMIKDDLCIMADTWIKRARKAGWHYPEFDAIERTLTVFEDPKNDVARLNQFLESYLGEFLGRMDTPYIRLAIYEKMRKLDFLIQYDIKNDTFKMSPRI